MIPLSVPNLSGNEAKYLRECIDTNFVSSVGPFVSRFERMSANYTGSANAVAVSSGTAGLHLALVVARVSPGDLVVLPSFTFIASANAIAHCGAVPWLFDISEESWTLDPELVRATLRRAARRDGDRLVHIDSGKRVAAIMPVYPLGLPADMGSLQEIAEEYQLPLIADAAAAIGAKYKGKNLAELATLSVLSFNGNKTATTGGGGIVFGNEEPLLSKARHLSTTARCGTGYDHDCIGFNYRLTNLQAAVGCAQLERLDEFLASKRRIDQRYRLELAGIPGICFFPHPAWAQSACWLSGITIDEGAHRIEKLCPQLRAQGIEARTFWKPIHLQAPYRAAPRTATPISDDVWQRILTLPCSTGLSDDEQSYVIRTLWQLLR